MNASQLSGKKLSKALKNKAKKYKVRITKTNSKGKRVYKTPTQINKEIRNRGRTKLRMNNFGVRNEDNDVNIYFIRHGQSCSNYLGARGSIKFDPKLTDCGIARSIAYGNMLRSKLNESGKQVHFLGSSLLRRAIETANYMFPEENLPIYYLPYVGEFHGTGIDATLHKGLKQVPLVGKGISNYVTRENKSRFTQLRNKSGPDFPYTRRGIYVRGMPSALAKLTPEVEERANGKYLKNVIFGRYGEPPLTINPEFDLDKFNHLLQYIVKDLRRQYGDNTELNIFIVTHSNTLKDLLGCTIGDEPRGSKPNNNGVYKIKYNEQIHQLEPICEEYQKAVRMPIIKNNESWIRCRNSDAKRDTKRYNLRWATTNPELHGCTSFYQQSLYPRSNEDLSQLFSQMNFDPMASRRYASRFEPLEDYSLDM